MMDEGYEKFSKFGKAFVVPLFANEPFLILPPTKMKQISSLPHDKIDAEVMHAESLQTKYTVGEDISGYNAYHFDVVRRQLTRKLPLLTEDIAQELVLACQDQWGSTTEWNSVRVYETCMRIVSRAANRVFGGKDLCRNQEFLEASKMYSQAVFKAGAMIKLWPAFVRPIVGPLIARSSHMHFDTALKHALPVIEHRLKNTHKKAEDPTFDWTPPNDGLQWLIEECMSTQTNPIELHPRMLARRLLNLNMVAIHTTSMGITNTLFDIYSSPDANAIVASLREECERVLAAHGSHWSKEAINSLHRHDSAIRESMRFSDMGFLGMQRMVVAKGGVDFGDGIIVPQGVRLATPNSHIHHDPAFYGDSANSYNPFRFSAPREDYEATLKRARADGKAEADIRKVLELKNQALVTVGPNFLGFGNGIHSCPGRFFASQEMKLMLATVVMHYDILPLEKRPVNSRLTTAKVPSAQAEMRVRKRQT